MDLLHLDFVKCSSSWSHKGLFFLVGYLKAVSSVCVLQWGHLLFSCKLCSLFFPSSQFPIIMFNLFSLSFNILIMRHLVHVWYSMLTDLIPDDILKCTKPEYYTNWWRYSPPLVCNNMKTIVLICHFLL